MNCTKCGMPIADGGDNGCRCNLSSGSSVCSTIFAERDESLRVLGFDAYEHYLTSDLWKHVKSNLKYQRRCEICGSESGLAWHHREYSVPVLVGNFPTNSTSPIVRVCNSCHKIIHSHDGNWFPLDVADDRYLMLLNDPMSRFMPETLPSGPFDIVAELSDYDEFASPGGFSLERKQDS